MQETLVRLLGPEDTPGEGIGYPLQYSWASLVSQLVKNPPAMREVWVRSLGWEDPLEKGKATHPSIPAGEFHGLSVVHGVTNSRTPLSDFHSPTQPCQESCRPTKGGRPSTSLLATQSWTSVA